MVWGIIGKSYDLYDLAIQCQMRHKHKKLAADNFDVEENDKGKDKDIDGFYEE